MKRIVALLLAATMLLLCASCGKKEETPPAEPQLVQMQAICELAVMDCYYHNVAKYMEEDAEKGLFGLFSKDKRFWIEYSGRVTVGIDASQVSIQVSGDQVTVTLPPAMVLETDLDEDSLTKDSFIVAKGSADVTAEDERVAMAEAQESMRITAENDAALLNQARERARQLLEDYVENIGRAAGKQYQITWIDLE